MENINGYLILAASIITSAGVIFNYIKGLGKNSKNSVDKYIENQMAPGLKEIKDSIESVHNEISILKKESDEDKMQRLRYDCLCFASDIRKGIAKTRQEYEEIFRMETEYDKLIDKYDIKNGFMEEEMLYVHKQYRSLNGE